MSRESVLSDRARNRLDQLFDDHDPLIPRPHPVVAAATALKPRFVAPLRDQVEKGRNAYLAATPSPLEKVIELQAETLGIQHRCIEMLDARLQAIEGRLDRQGGVILRLVDVVLSDEPGDDQGADMSAPENPL